MSNASTTCYPRITIRMSAEACFERNSIGPVENALDCGTRSLLQMTLLVISN